MHEKGKRFSTNIAKGESRNNRETKFHEWTMPSRILYSTNIAKGESRNNRETKFHEWTMPSRILYSTNIDNNILFE